MTSLSKRPRRALFGISAAAALLAATAATPAAAEIIETSTISNSYQYLIGTESGSISNAGATAFISASNTRDDGALSEGAMQLTSYLDGDGNFYFLQNGFCSGLCNLLITTEITFTLKNTGPDAVDLRFDTQITPGHIARRNWAGGGDSGSLFNFTVYQDFGTSSQNKLYEALGYSGTSQPGVNTSNGTAFNGVNFASNEPDFSTTDWSATNLSLQLSTLAAGATTTIRYKSIMQVLNNADCRGGLLSSICAGFQVAFGDPREKGSVDALAALRSEVDVPDSAADAVNGALPAVGGLYDPYRVTNRFVQLDPLLPNPPLPTTPSVIGPIAYNTGYVPFADAEAAVAEPATWAMMIAGFGFIGGSMRARRGDVARNSRLAA